MTSRVRAASIADHVLDDLLEGNRRHATGAPAHASTLCRERLARGQTPVATILACADARVSPELVFDQPQGRVFVVRNVGHVLDNATVASVEYGVTVLQTPLVVVMGHTGCAAIEAALTDRTGSGAWPGVVGAVRKSLRSTWSDLCATPREAEIHHTGRVALGLARESDLIRNALLFGRSTRLVAALYDVRDGIVRLVDPVANTVRDPDWVVESRETMKDLRANLSVLT